MKNSVFHSIAVLALAVAMLPCRSHAEGYVLVKVQDMCKKSTTQIMSDTEYKALEKTIQLENRYFQQALQAAAKEWRENEANKGTPFAGSRLMPRKFVGTAERFSNQEKAQQKLTALEDMEMKREDRAREREIAKAKSGGGRKNKEEMAREFDRENALMGAAEVVSARLAEIISAKAAPPAAAGAAGAAGAKAPDAGGAAAKEAGQRAL